MTEFLSVWPWALAALFLIAYELYALWTKRPGGPASLWTLSKMATQAARRHPWLPWVVVGLTAYLYLHFWGCTTFSICIP